MFISEDSYQDITAKLQTTQTNKQNKDIKLEWIVLKNKTWTLNFFQAHPGFDEFFCNA